MSKKIKTFQDISQIVLHKVDIKSDVGSLISFITFLNMKLIDVKIIIDNGEYTYEIT